MTYNLTELTRAHILFAFNYYNTKLAAFPTDTDELYHCCPVKVASILENIP